MPSVYYSETRHQQETLARQDSGENIKNTKERILSRALDFCLIATMNERSQEEIQSIVA
jgi:hypothetical protein